MPIDRVRHGRQIRLPEIGEAGQARLDASTVVLGSPAAAVDAREIEASYLRRAGISVRETADTKPNAKANANAEANAEAEAATKNALAALGMKDSVARGVAEGALRALCAMRKILGIEPPA